MDFSSLAETAKSFGLDQNNQDSIRNEQIFKVGQEMMKQLKKVNIIITGKTGVGKSTLINACFRKKLAATGMGKPVTQESQWLEDGDIPLRIYDTVGLELSEERQQGVAETMKKMIRARRNQGDEDKMIHCVWYCVQAPSDRFEPAEEEFIRELAEEENVPVILVLTKAYFPGDAQEFKQKILEDYPYLPAKEICVVLAEDKKEVSRYGLDALVETTADCLEDDELRISWCNAQNVSLKMKKAAAEKMVKQAVIAAGAIGLNPVPVSDAVFLVPNQIVMMIRISNVFGFPVTKQWAMNVAGSLMGASGATIVGRMVVSNLLKFIPVVGSAAGGAISGVTAGLLTLALGNAYIRWMEYMYDNGKGTTEDWMSDSNKDILTDLFKDSMKVATPEMVKELLKDAKTADGEAKK